MKIPLNWLNEFVALPKNSKDLTDKLTMIGHMLDKKSVINGETIIDLELRGNRADCYSILGVAREVSAIFSSKVKSIGTERLIRVSKLENSSLKVKTPMVKRAAMLEITDVKITDSPDWLKNKLISYGMESVNNIVDLTNYVMIEIGEPMHAFDLDKIRGKELEIRLAKDKEKITTFSGAGLTLTKEDLVWATGDYVLSVAGAIGEKYNSISESTKNILVEAANYDRANIRKSVYRHNLLTEAGIRHEKDLDPNMVETALGHFLYFIKKYNWGNFDSTFFDYYPHKVNPWKIKLSLSQLLEIGGVNIERAGIKKILTSLNFKIIKFDKTSVEVEVPTYRTDVTLEEDLIEEILRIYGYDKIPAHVLSLEIPDQITPHYIIQEDKLRAAASVGFSEAITLSFVKNDLSKYNIHPQKAEAEVISLVNPPSPDNKNLRITLFPNLSEVVQKSIYEGGEEIRLFEIGKIYYKYKNEYKEERRAGFAYANKSDKSFAGFKSLIESFFENFGMDSATLVPEILLLPLLTSFEITVGENRVGYGGMLNNIYFAELDLDSLLGFEKKYQVKLWPKYPPQIEDITLQFPEKTLIGNAVNLMKSSSKLISKVELTTIYKDSYTFRIWYQDPQKTLTDKDVDELRSKIISGVKNKFGGTSK